MLSLVKGCLLNQQSTIYQLQRRQQLLVQQQLPTIIGNTISSLITYKSTSSSLLFVSQTQSCNSYKVSSNHISSTTLQQHRFYITRAHPKPTPEFSIIGAINDILKDIEQRKVKRRRRFKNASNWGKREPFVEPKHPDETIEFAINLNVDPRKPGQALRGSMTLPYGSGKKLNCLVFTTDETLAQHAIENGATHAGGEQLIDRIVAGDIPVDQFQRAIGTKEIMPLLTRKLARVLGPRGLMPNDKLGTILPPVQQGGTSTPDDTTKKSLSRMLETIVSGKEVTYRTEKEGIVHVPVGKGSFGFTKLLTNIGQVMQVIFDAKPDVFGKGRKKGTPKSISKNTKYFLRASITSTQGISRRIDLRTVDPSSPFFLSDTTASTTNSTIKLPTLTTTNDDNDNTTTVSPGTESIVDNDILPGATKIETI